jgi:Zeta toxin
MSDIVSRELDSPKKVRHFLTNILQYKYDDPTIETKIVKGQNGIIQFGHFKNFNTYDNDDYRIKEYFGEDERWRLRNQIVDELISFERLDSDDDICLEKGGACPKSGLKGNKEAYLIIGLPASGKSGIANTISESVGGLILDSDYAKRKLPEFSLYEYGATLVHKESSKIVSGFDSKPERFNEILSLNERAIINKYNVVIPRIGHSLNDVLTIARNYRKLSYKIHLILVNLNRRKATIRAIKRYIDTNRYVPLDLIYDEYGNDPILNYYQIKTHLPNEFDSYGMITTNVNFGDSYRCVEFTENNPAQLYAPINFENCI